MTMMDERVDLTVLEDLAPPCDTDFHDTIGDGPAVWAITVREYADGGCCDCPLPNNPILMCDLCWQFINSYEGRVVCSRCGVESTLSREIVKVERL